MIKKELKLKRAIVRVGDIIPHEVPKDSFVATLTNHLLKGGTLPPMHIDITWKEHFKQGPTGMDSTGVGHMLLDGHHRRAAYLRAFGRDFEVEVVHHE
jgi:hypothetical protein